MWKIPIKLEWKFLAIIFFFFFFCLLAFCFWQILLSNISYITFMYLSYMFVIGYILKEIDY